MNKNERVVTFSRTLAIDIGGTGIKGMILDESGNPISDRHAIPTPHPGTPKAVLKVIYDLAQVQGTFDRLSVGFPGVVKSGVVCTAVNLDSMWHNFDLACALTEHFGKPVFVVNDADIQGLGAIVGNGLELVITLGTGFGSALFHNGILIPNLEIAHHFFEEGKTYEQCLGKAALELSGKDCWNAYLQKAIVTLESMFHYDCLYIGGGHTAHINFELPPNVKIVPNVAGILGGIALWRKSMIER